MSVATRLWIRHEARSTEQRAPVVPADVRRLLDSGLQVTVEESRQRAFPIGDYAAAGAVIAGTGSWVDAPDDVFVLGIKELPEDPPELRHRHIYFAHAFKGQADAADTLARFRKGGGRLYDIEYLTDDTARRVVAFGYWAGYVGAALGVLAVGDALHTPLRPMDQETLDAEVRAVGEAGIASLSAVVTGARGRSGRGARAALAVAGIQPMHWDRAESRTRDIAELLQHDILVNCVFNNTPAQPFVGPADLDRPRRLRMVADVTCDVTSSTNMLPVNRAITTWAEPVRRVTGREGGWLDVIAVDNLPSLLPREASETFSADLTPHLLGLGDHPPVGPWNAAAAAYDKAMAELDGLD